MHNNYTQIAYRYTGTCRCTDTYVYVIPLLLFLQKLQQNLATTPYRLSELLHDIHYYTHTYRDIDTLIHTGTYTLHIRTSKHTIYLHIYCTHMHIHIQHRQRYIHKDMHKCTKIHKHIQYTHHVIPP